MHASIRFRISAVAITPTRLAALALIALLPALMRPAPAFAQPTCDDPQPLVAGTWQGVFQVQLERRWTAPLSPTDATPGRWQDALTVRGGLDLLVRGPDAPGGEAVLGLARATWQSETTSAGDDGASSKRTENGWLSGGALTTPRGRDLAAVDALTWSGAWWSGPPGSRPGGPFSLATESRRPGGPTLYGDGWVMPRPATPIRFIVETATCRTINGTVEPTQFVDPDLMRPNGLETVMATGTFRLDRR